MKRFFPIMTAFLMVVLGFTVSSASTASAATAVEDQKANAAAIAEFFELHNKQRIEHGLNPLVFSPQLSALHAQTYAMKLASTDAALKHQETGQFLRVKGSTSVGENLAWGSGSHGTPSHLIQALMDSPPHRANILDPEYNTIGIGWTISPSGRSYTTILFWSGNLQDIGPTYSSGTLVEGALTGKTVDSTVDIYITEGLHNSGGRQWRTECEAYSQTERCRTEIWATQIVVKNGVYVNQNGWVFNNLTYKASSRNLWKGNPLGGNGVVGGKVSWTADDGRKWRTECDTALTGRGGCRSFIEAEVIEKVGNTYKFVKKEMFNNMVRFSG